MRQLTRLEDIETLIATHRMSFLYISQQTCSVCHALLPKVEAMLQKFPHIESSFAQIDDIPELAGRFSVFTAPVLLLFVEGKEVMRKARFVTMGELEADIRKYYELVM
ncbi:thioredoxin family protein [Aneurinibacillus danicus]|uniref:Thioredoxin-like protein YdfQ n=1 Tax=Aneurinibacillus danicus TaxID=267746 RepID=A0A511VCP3_9BACL|nr:thioredoxin family protein [Aneurinibacillus danicus]GEN36657.1 thioredoxin-like protein YdfQ [Aneurinibacillus danicus]